jgi:hypothetical protein
MKLSVRSDHLPAAWFTCRVVGRAGCLRHILIHQGVERGGFDLALLHHHSRHHHYRIVKMDAMSDVEELEEMVPLTWATMHLELLEMIMESVTYDSDGKMPTKEVYSKEYALDLLNWALVCRQWRHAAQRILYNTKMSNRQVLRLLALVSGWQRQEKDEANPIHRLLPHVRYITVPTLGDLIGNQIEYCPFPAQHPKLQDLTFLLRHTRKAIIWLSSLDYFMYIMDHIPPSCQFLHLLLHARRLEMSPVLQRIVQFLEQARPRRFKLDSVGSEFTQECREPIKQLLAMYPNCLCPLISSYIIKGLGAEILTTLHQFVPHLVVPEGASEDEATLFLRACGPRTVLDLSKWAGLADSNIVNYMQGECGKASHLELGIEGQGLDLDPNPVASEHDNVNWGLVPGRFGRFDGDFPPTVIKPCPASLLRRLMSIFTHLYTLDLTRQHHLDDECLQVIGQGMDSLHTLNLSGCLSVTDAGIQAMLFKHSLDDSGHRVPIFPLELQVQKLRNLNISFTRVSCQGFVAIGRMIVQNSQQGLLQTGSFSIDVSCCESLSRNALLHVCQRVCAEIGEDVILARAQPLIRREPLIKLEFPRWDDEDNFEVDRQLFWKLVMCGVYWWDGHHRVGPGQSISWLADRWDYLLRHAGIRNG